MAVVGSSLCRNVQKDILQLTEKVHLVIHYIRPSIAALFGQHYH
jgi:hypothetical protein